jgi:hypothetical protein
LVKSKMEISSNLVAFSKNTNFKPISLINVELLSSK